jgi:hypothetical protein
MQDTKINNLLTINSYKYKRNKHILVEDGIRLIRILELNSAKFNQFNKFIGLSIPL